MKTEEEIQQRIKDLEKNKELGIDWGFMIDIKIKILKWVLED